MMSMKRIVQMMPVALLMLVVSACTDSAPRSEALPEPEPPTYVDAFNTVGSWDTYNSESFVMDVAGEMMRGVFSQAGRYAWSLNHQRHQNVAIELTVQDVSAHDGSIMGLMCRASPQNNGRGYHFLISGDGAFSIRYGTGNGDEALVRWQNHGALQEGANRLRVVCDGAELTFFANGRRLASTRDDRYSSGSVGLVLGLPSGVSAGTTADIAFDDLRVWHLP